MENNIFEKMLFESDQTFKQIKGMKPLNEAENKSYSDDEIKNGKEFLVKLKLFHKTQKELLALWDYGTDNLISDFSAKYPFESSFDEYGIDDWEKDFEKQLNKTK